MTDTASEIHYFLKIRLFFSGFFTVFLNHLFLQSLIHFYPIFDLSAKTIAVATVLVLNYMLWSNIYVKHCIFETCFRQSAKGKMTA